MLVDYWPKLNSLIQGKKTGKLGFNNASYYWSVFWKQQKSFNRRPNNKDHWSENETRGGEN